MMMESCRNVLILKGGDDIGGRVKSTEFGGVTIELGANWIQGLLTNINESTENPLWPLKTLLNLEGNITDFMTLLYMTLKG